MQHNIYEAANFTFPQSMERVLIIYAVTSHSGQGESHINFSI